MITIKNLNLKGKLLILNEIKKQADETIKTYKTKVLPEIVETEDCTILVEDVGHLKLAKNTTKTIEEVITEKQSKIIELQQEIENLKLFDKNDIVITRQGNLNCYTTDEAKQLANDLLQDLLENNLNSKALKNKASKNARIK